MAEHTFTPDQIEQGIASAVAKRDFHIIPSLVKLLAVQAPRRAGRVLDALQGKYTITVDLHQPKPSVIPAQLAAEAEARRMASHQARVAAAATMGERLAAAQALRDAQAAGGRHRQ